MTNLNCVVIHLHRPISKPNAQFLTLYHCVSTGDRLGLVDVHVYPWFERFPVIRYLSKLAGHEYDPLPVASFPNLTAWAERMEALPEVKETMLPREWHMEFMMKLRARQPEYDIGLNADSAKL